MLITGLLITGGFLYTWTRIYQKNKKKIKLNTQLVTHSSPKKRLQKFKDDKPSQLDIIEKTDINDIEEWIDHYIHGRRHSYLF